MTISQQAECLRFYGREEEARQVESGQLVIPPDALDTSWTCMQVAQVAQAFRPRHTR